MAISLMVVGIVEYFSLKGCTEKVLSTDAYLKLSTLHTLHVGPHMVTFHRYLTLNLQMFLFFHKNKCW